MPRYIYDTFRTPIENRSLIPLTETLTSTGENWDRFGGNLTAPYNDRVNKETPGLSAVIGTFLNIGGTVGYFNEQGVGNWLHPGNKSTYYVNTPSTDYDVSVSFIGNYRHRAYSYVRATPGEPRLISHLQSNGNHYWADYTYDLSTAQFKVRLGKNISGADTVLATYTVPTLSGSINYTYDKYAYYKLTMNVTGTRKRVYLYAKHTGLFGVNVADTVSSSNQPVLVIDYSESSSAITSPGFVGLQLRQNTAYGDAGTKSFISQFDDLFLDSFSATFAPIALAASGFPAGSYQPSPAGIVCAGANIEGGLKPYKYVWIKTLGAVTTNLAEQTNPDLFDPNVSTGNTYTYTQTVIDASGTIITAGSFSLSHAAPGTTPPPPPTGPIPPVTYPRPQQTVGAKARLVAAPLGSNGIQSFYTGFTTNDQIAGMSSILKHPDGNFYVLFTANSSANSQDRRLYFSKSTDGGYSWSTAIAITSGYWDDCPSIVNIDDTSSSLIGVVFVRSFSFTSTSTNTQLSRIYRATINTLGVQIGGIDPISALGAIENPSYVSLTRRVDGYLVGYTTNNQSVSFYFNTSFITNNWVVPPFTSPDFISAIPSLYAIGASPYINSIRIRALSNGHIAMVVSLTYTSNNVNNYALQYFTRNEVYTSFSSDLGATWSTPQRVTPYTDNCTINLDDSLSAMSPDIIEMQDGKLGIIYSEQANVKALNARTDPSINSFFGMSMSEFSYNEARGLLAYGSIGQYTGDGQGVYVYNFNTGASVRFSTNTAVQLWWRDILCCKISPDGNYIAAGTTQSLEIIDSSDSNPLNWTVLSLRTSTVPATRNASIGAVYWKSNTELYIFYSGSTGIGGVLGSKIDLTLNPGDTGYITDLVSGSLATRIGSGSNIIARSNHICFIDSNGNFNALAVTPGYTSGYIALGSPADNGIIYHDPYLDLYIISTNGGTVLRKVMVRESGTGVNVTLVTPYNVPSGIGLLTNSLDIQGGGFLAGNAGFGGKEFHTWYSYYDEKTYGILDRAEAPYLQTSLITGFGPPRRPYSITTPDKKWIIMQNQYSFVGAGILFYPLNRQGNIKYAFFDYNPSTQQVTIPSVLTYTPLANATKIGSDVNYFIYPSVIRGNNNELFLTGTYWRLNAAQGNFKIFFSKVEPDAYLLTTRARIVARADRSITARARTARDYTSSIDVRVLIVFAQCIKIRVKITPVTNTTINIKGTIEGRKTSSMTGVYNISSASISRLLGTFYAGNGYNTVATLQTGAFIVKSKETTLFGRFIINVSPSATTLPDVSSRVVRNNFMSIRVRIS